MSARLSLSCHELAPFFGPAYDALAARLHNLQFELKTLTYDEYMEKLAEKGGIVEEVFLCLREQRGRIARLAWLWIRIAPSGQSSRT